MEQAQYWMWMKRRPFLKSNFQVWKSSIGDSWEEKAFAEDACGNPGGCIWPPRSYSCSFCKREFRSAQALGGHMNVHRRDRARLNQSLSPQNDLLQYQNHSQTNFQTEVCTLDFDLHLNSISSSTIAASTLSSSRVSAQENLSDHTFVSSNKVSNHNYDQSGSDSLAVVENPREETCLNDDDDFAETYWLMGFNSAENPNSPTDSYGDIRCKRPKTISFSMKPCSSDRYSFRSEITEANSNSMQDIDLELRLGEPPKVK